MHPSFREVVIALGAAISLLLVLILGFGHSIGAGTAHAFSPGSVAITQSYQIGTKAGKYTCYRLRVTLGANKSETRTCLLQNPPLPGEVAPKQSDCTINDMQLFADAEYGGPEICFTMNPISGYNQVDLTIYPFGWCCGDNWNDKVSSYKTGIWDGAFSWDTGGNGARYPVVSDLLCPWIGSYWNDQASTLIMIKGTNDTQRYC